jgi:hypothetical protein
MNIAALMKSNKWTRIMADRVYSLCCISTGLRSTSRSCGFYNIGFSSDGYETGKSLCMKHGRVKGEVSWKGEVAWGVDFAKKSGPRA